MTRAETLRVRQDLLLIMVGCGLIALLVSVTAQVLMLNALTGGGGGGGYTASPNLPAAGLWLGAAVTSAVYAAWVTIRGVVCLVMTRPTMTDRWAAQIGAHLQRFHLTASAQIVTRQIAVPAPPASTLSP